ncbi:4-hydroxybenzoate 3-monooxygenase [Chromobacterium haemolyticum]|uniref:4-hydroxybenzoate 3-monooxygenase n=1 Tax=Chromobacterium haemolyticum TaxID=394935 RepID=UPI0009DB0C04|nr:4-hydroxybenzoate 3-monooxygenase [Chromobacterium haemolyticum]MDH0343465.1 4-hydroxybenzoate 3-monooxygenase [Chromobacterium haemolyticum]OQS38553.1 4-hydroxybenzoate 3-monooxygenase [Chromobacterium haemolyticum]BBH13017.1 4-hydroxybenzoate 3-monooxygenase [Chromobacterium haemolyticum]
MRTSVGIIGAGPAGLLLAQLLQRHGIDSVVLEARGRAEIESTVRAGVLEPGTVELLAEAGADARLRRLGQEHRGIALAFDGGRHRIDLYALTGRAITVYAQHELLKDLIAARLEAGGGLLFDCPVTALEAFDGSGPARIRYRDAGGERALECDFIVGCDGFHGIARQALGEREPPWQRQYPFAWFGILAATPPSAPELIYACHERGFALVSTRSPTLQRLYFQCAPDDSVDAWPDARIWDELQARVPAADGVALERGEILHKNIVAMRSFVARSLQRGRLFLAGDAAHIVPPTGAKGLNLAAADVRLLALALVEHFRNGSEAALLDYSRRALRRIWRAEHFSWRLTGLLHAFPDAGPFEREMQRAELDYLVSSRAAATSLAENYVGMPRDWD